MCLTTKRKTRKAKSKKDIIVYKYVFVDGKSFLTPFHHMRIRVPSTVKIDEFGRNKNMIEEGLHSFANRSDAENFMYFHGHPLYDIEDRIVVKCVIPKNTYYYKGTFYGAKTYASLKLRYVEVL